MPPDRTDPGEVRLIERLRARDEAAVEELLARYETRVFGLALRITGNREDAEEVLQDVAWRVLERVDGFRGDSKLSSWIYRIATNVALMKLRARRRRDVVPLPEELGPAMTEDGTIAEPVADWSGPASQELLRKELAGRLGAALDELHPDYRAALVLRDVEGLSTEDAAAALEVSVAALKSRLHRARLYVRKRLADYVAIDRPTGAPPRAGGDDAEVS